VLTEHAHLKDPLSYKIKRKIARKSAKPSHLKSSKTWQKIRTWESCPQIVFHQSAYGSEQILLPLVPAFGLAAFAMLMPMTSDCFNYFINCYLVISKCNLRYIPRLVVLTSFPRITLVQSWHRLQLLRLMLDYIVTLSNSISYWCCSNYLNLPRACRLGRFI